jgi:basic amino acid/polyamine antiporter, APA family
MTGNATLNRRLSLVTATAIVVGNVIGTGVFLKARVMTCNVGSPGLVLLAYALGGVFTIAGALSLAELSAMLPHSGGPYNFIGAAFGRVWAFLYGWMETLIDGAASIAVLAIAVVVFLQGLTGTTTTGMVRLEAIGVIAIIVAICLLSVGANGAFAAVVTGLKVLLVLGIGIGAFLLGDGSWGHFAASGAAGTCEGVADSARLGITGFGAAVVGALWSYNGWTALTFMAGEVRAPGRTLPRALIVGTVILGTLYLMVNAGYFFQLPPEAVASVPESGSVAQEVLVRLVGRLGAAVMAVGLALSSFGALHSVTLSVSRVAYAMARDGLLPARLATISRRTRVPSTAVLVIGMFAVAFTLTGTFDLLTDLIIFVLLIFTGLAVAAVYALRRKLPDQPRPYRVLGYPVVPAVFLLATAFLMVNTLVATPGRAIAGIGIVLLGLPVYWWHARQLPADRPEAWIGGDQRPLSHETT